MKRLLALILVVGMLLAMTGCSKNDDPVVAGSSPSAAAPETTATAPADGLTNDALDDPLDDALAGGLDDPLDDQGADPLEGLIDEGADDPLDTGNAVAPTPSAPAGGEAAVAIKDYQLDTYTDENLGISLKYPAHWTVEPGASSLSFAESNAIGAVPMRLALSVKSYEEKLSAAQQKKEFNAFLKVVKGSYETFKVGKVNNKLSFMNRASLSCKYNAVLDGAKVKGFVVMTNDSKNKQIVALHFYAPAKQFNSCNAFFKKILYSVAPVASEG